MSKLNWSCSACGMSSGRKESVRRHINNPRIHDGRAIPIPYVEYLAGLSSGSYGPPTAYPILAKKQEYTGGYNSVD